MYKFALLIASALTLASVGSVVTKTKLATPTGDPQMLTPSIEQMTLAARDLPEQSFQAY